MPGEAVSADGEATASYPEDLAEIIHEGGYTTQQIFYVDKTTSIGKRHHPGLSYPERRSQCLASKDKLTLSLGANAAGDFKLKSVLIYHSRSPRAHKNYAKSPLPVLCKWNNKA